MLKNCSTCGAQTRDYSEFPSPHEPGLKIVRCKACRKISNPYPADAAESKMGP